MDTSNLRAAYAEFLDVASRGPFGEPPEGEWSAEQLLAHIIATDHGIAAAALAIVAGQRPTYDNRYGLDEWNLARIMAEHPSLPELIGAVARGRDVLADVAEHLSEAEASTRLHWLVIDGSDLVADEDITLRDLIDGVARVHLPRHGVQLASLAQE